MKINVTVDLEDFYPEEDGGNIAEQIKETIERNVVSTIWKKVKEEGFESLCSQIERKVNLDKDLKIKEILDTYFKEKKVKKSRYDSGTFLTIEDYITENLNSEYFHTGDKFDRRVTDFLTKNSEEIIKQLKDRYDLLFASQIVNNLNKQGMLKEDIAKILLTENN